MGKRSHKDANSSSTDSPARKDRAKDVIISDVSSLTRNKFSPVLLNFKHAPANVDNLLETNPSIDLEVKGWNANKKNTDMSLTFKTEHIPYVNTDDKQDSFYTTYIAIRDRKTGKTRLIEATNVLMKPEVTPPPSTNPVLLKKETENISSEERFETNKQLIKAFGQRKGQRYYENKEALRVDEEDAEAKVLRAAGGVDASSLSVGTAPTDKIDIIPPRDATAGRADMIYRAEHLLTEREQTEMTEACTAVLEQFNSAEMMKKAEKDRQLSPLGVQFLKPLLDKESLDYKAGLALYLDTIVRFNKFRPMDLKKGHNALPKHIPVMIKKKIFDEFSTGVKNQRIVTPPLKDKAICYIIVLCLMLNNQKIETSAITEAVRVDQRNLRKLVMMTGANLENDAATSQQLIVLRKKLADYDVNYVAKSKKDRKK